MADIPVGFTLRPEVVEECRVLGDTPEEAIAKCLTASTASYLVSFNDSPAVLWGYIDCLSFANMWALTTDLVTDFPLTFIRESRRLRDALLTLFPTLICGIHQDFPAAVKWAEGLGFVITASRPDGFLIMQKDR